eukprot:608118_1
MMSTDLYERLYFKYILISMWTVEVIVIFIVLLIELRTYHNLLYRVHLKALTLQNLPTKSVSNSKKSASSRAPLPSSSSSSSLDEPKPPSKLMFILTILSYACYVIVGISAVVGLLGFPSCGIAIHTCPIAYVLAKCFMYFVYIYRLHLVYSASQFAYNKNLLLVLCVCVAMNAIFQVTFYALICESYVKIYHYPNGERLCSVKVPKINLISTAALDLLIASFCTYLFIRPLLKLNQFQSEDKPNNSFTKLFEVGQKYSLLALVSVSSTVLILAVIRISKHTSLIIIDIIINSICMMFFSKQYDYHYKIICCGAIAVWRRLFHR